MTLSTPVVHVLETIGPAARGRLRPFCQNVGLTRFPERLTLLGLKEERLLEVWGRHSGGTWAHIRTYPVLGASGVLGPKQHEGDGQVPEGIYALTHLNPRSRFHLSMRIGYPNAEDRQHAKAEGRMAPGSDIYIHGGTDSAGCLAMGDAAIEELFVLVAEMGLPNVSVLLAPCDLRVKPAPRLLHAPGWLAERYAALAEAMQPLTSD